jgi:TolA-binding protein
VPASEVDRLQHEHEAQLQDLRTHANQVSELEAELKRLIGVEAKVQQDFNQQLAQQREELEENYQQEVEELRVEQEARDKERDSSLSKLMDEREHWCSLCRTFIDGACCIHRGPATASAYLGQAAARCSPVHLRGLMAMGGGTGHDCPARLVARLRAH